MPKIDLTPVDKVTDLQRNLKDYIEANDKKISAIYRKAGMVPSTFHRKLKNQTFTMAELRTIIEIINR